MIDLFGITPLLKILRLRKPGMVFVTYRHNLENDMLKFVLVLPSAGAADVVNRELSVQVADQTPVTINVDVSRNETDELSGVEGEVVKGSLVDVDDAGNRSEPRDFEFTLVDNLAPPRPGQVGVRVTEEIIPAPEPINDTPVDDLPTDDESDEPPVETDPASPEA